MMCALLATVINPVASVAATRMVSDQGLASGLVLLGITMAFMVGVPLATLIGHQGGWQATALASGFMLVLASGITWVGLPTYLNKPIMGTQGLKDLAVGLQVWQPLLLTLLGFMATFTVTAFIAPVITQATGIKGNGISVMQAMVGVGSLAGIIAGIKLAHQPTKVLPWLFGVISVSLALYSVWMWAGPKLPGIKLAMAMTIFIGASALFAMMPIMQTLLVNKAGIKRQSALALNSAMLFGGQGLGAACGGWIIANGFIQWLGMAGAIIAFVGGMVSTIKK